MKDLTIENAKNVMLIQNKKNPEHGVVKFNFDGSSDKFHSFGVGSDSAILFEEEFRFWNVIKSN